MVKKVQFPETAGEVAALGFYMLLRGEAGRPEDAWQLLGKLSPRFVIRWFRTGAEALEPLDPGAAAAGRAVADALADRLAAAKARA